MQAIQSDGLSVEYLIKIMQAALSSKQHSHEPVILLRMIASRPLLPILPHPKKTCPKTLTTVTAIKTLWKPGKMQRTQVPIASAMK